MRAMVIGWICAVTFTQSPRLVNAQSVTGSPIGEKQKTCEEVYDAYVKALRRKDGKSASTCASQSTIDLYERCRKRALDSTGVDFEEVSQLEVVLIFQLRLMRSRKELEADDGKSVFEWGINNGLVNESGYKGLTISKVQVDGKKAIATLKKDGKPVTDVVFNFVLEKGQWRLDMVPIMMGAESAFAQIRKDAKKSKIDFAVYLLERNFKREIPPQILEGPLK